MSNKNFNGNDSDYTLTDAEVAKYLGRPVPMDCNLGYQVPTDKLTDNPARVMGKGQHRAGLVAGKATKSTGTCTQENFDMWANFSSKNSYHGSSQKPK
jgi:hypothetical protein